VSRFPKAFVECTHGSRPQDRTRFPQKCSNVIKSGSSDHHARQRTGSVITADDLARLAYEPAEIEQRTKAIYCRCLAESTNLCPGNYSTLHTQDLQLLFALYDEYFLRGVFRGRNPTGVGFRVSSRMTRSAGMVTYRHESGPYTVSISGTLLLQAFGGSNDPVLVNGLACCDRLEATMRVLEHEIVHLLELTTFGSTSCARARFRRLSRSIFGHTDVTHELAGGGHRRSARIVVRPGDTVQFGYRGRLRRGVVCRITKRATVMVRDPRGTYVDRVGARYSKYYVPLHCLQ
jgi:hypothetical protein